MQYLTKIIKQANRETETVFAEKLSLNTRDITSIIAEDIETNRVKITNEVNNKMSRFAEELKNI